MAIYALPWGDHLTASSRLRVWNIAPHIEDYYVGTPEEYKKGDLLLIQKIPDRTEMKRAQDKGIRVIYDIDDYYWDKSEFRTMVQDADAITVDTEEKKQRLGFCGRKKQLATVIPDSLDWDGTKKATYGKGVIGWTGYGNNAHYLNPVIPLLKHPVRLITTADWLEGINRDYNEKVQSRPWSVEMVDKYLAECDLGVYYLPDGEFEQMKGMHKLLKNWAIGLPTYTSPMPDYVKANQEAGVDYIVKHLEDWKKIDFVPFDEKCREYAMRYEAKAIAKQWTSLFSQL